MKYLIIPGKFQYHDAIKITEMLNNGFRIPSVEEGVNLIKENNYLLGSKVLITNEAKEFGEDGNWIYVASRSTSLNNVCDNSEGDYVLEYKKHPVRNNYYELVLIK